MKFFKMLIITIAIGSTGFATEKGDSRAKLLTALKANPAVQGALEQAKKWSGASSCEELQIEILSQHSFEVYATCAVEGDQQEEEEAGVGLGAQGQVHVFGTIYDSVDTPVIDKIEFSYAG